MNKGERIAKAVLTTAGLSISKIPEKNKKTADFYGVIKDEKYLIEVKTKDDKNPLYDDMKIGEIVSQVRKIEPRNRVAGIIKDGMKQIESSEQFNTDSFNILWLHSTGLDANFQNTQILYTFYGIMEILDLKQKDSNGTQSYPCYGFTFAEAYNHPNLDGLFMSSNDQSNLSISLRVNPYSTKITKFRNSELYKYFKKKGALTDPKLAEKKGRAFFVEEKLDLKKPAVVLEHLKSKYNKPNLHTFDWQQASAATLVPADI